MPNYANGKIYCIRNRADNDRAVYIGSTIRPLSERMSKHRGTMKLKSHIKIYQLMAEVGVENFHIELIADFPCESIEQLLAEEGRHIRLNDTFTNGVNSKMAGRSDQEFRAENRDVILAKQKVKYNENIDAIRQRYRERYAADKATYAARNLEYRQRHVEQLKVYEDTHKAQRTEKNKAYHTTHRVEIRARQTEYRQQHTEQRKAYADAHKVEKLEKNRAYRAAHREEINARQVVQRAERKRLAEAAEVAAPVEA